MTASSRTIGRCIYCDSTDGLTREHVIPEGIGGRWSPDGQHEALVLGKASCKSCREITRTLEGVCQGKMMGHFRAKAGLVRKDRQSNTRRVKYQDATGIETCEDVTLSDLPSALMLPVFYDAGLFSGQPIGGPYKIRHWLKVIDGNATALRPDQGLVAAGSAPGDYGRLLAKIGLGYAVAYFGIDGFKPLVRDFILGKNNDQFGHWICGRGDAAEDPPSPHMHEIGLRPITDKLTQTEYVAADIRLFAMYGDPRNYVVVGQRH
jgi:hypothetical protein